MTRIALVVLDTLRKDLFEKHFEWMEGVHYENAYSTGNYTVPAHASMFSGEWPHNINIHSKNEKFDYDDKLSVLLSNQGYKTYMMSSNPLVTNVNNFEEGFDEVFKTWQAMANHSFDWISCKDSSMLPEPLSYAECVTRCLISDYNFIDSMKVGKNLKRKNNKGGEAIINNFKETDFPEDSFLFVNLMEAHAPYDFIPDEWLTVDSLSSSERGTILGGDRDLSNDREAYNDCVRYLSNIYQDMYKELTETFDFVITVGDHGELFGEYGCVKHQYGVYPELVEIPLVVWSGDESSNSKKMVSIRDIYSTILSVAGIDYESEAIDITSDEENDFILTEYSGFRTKRKKSLEEDFDKSEVDKYDKPMFGVKFDSTEYIYKDHSGINSSSESLAKQYTDLLQKLDISYNADDSIDEEVGNQLEFLGYK